MSIAMSPTWLAIDCGNTRLKWAKINADDQITDEGVYGKTAYEDLLDRIDEISDIWICHVGNDHDRQSLQQRLKGMNKSVNLIRSQPYFAGLSNHYQPPSALGADRWLCLLAVHPSTYPIIIVSAGTAITVDLLTADGNFRGGLILPGLSLMAAALGRATPLTAVLPSTTRQSPDTTTGAMGMGIIYAVIGAIEKYRQRYCCQARVYITGGDAKILLPWIPSAQYQSNLVLRGIMRLRRLMIDQKAMP